MLSVLSGVWNPLPEKEEKKSMEVKIHVSYV